MRCCLKNGILYDVYPKVSDLYENREIYYNARYIVTDGKRIDLEDIQSIRSIPTPNFNISEVSNAGVTRNLVYILRMKAQNLKKVQKIELAITLLKRATEMMPISEIKWTRKDYMLFSEWLFEVGEPEEARKAVNSINKLFENFNRDVTNKNLKTAHKLKTDLVEASYFLGCCSECAKYRGRWFSVSGKDKRFPKMPKNYPCTCAGINFSPVIYGVDIPMYCPKGKDIISYSNRPFIDERTDNEKAIYQHNLDSKAVEIMKIKDKEDYKRLQNLIPDEVPKSFSAYRRMKTGETKNFIKLAEKADEIGLNIRLSEEEKSVIKRYYQFEKEKKESNN